MDEATFETARHQMVTGQIAARGVHDPRVLEAMRRVPRHTFVPRELAAQAYEDHPIHIGCRQTISQPYMVACMSEMLGLRAGDHVLEVGTGSGYQTAILAELVRTVVSIERHAALADSARLTLDALGYTNIRVVCGDGTLGFDEAAPYDAILVTAGGPGAPQALLAQLAEGGRMVCPTGGLDMQQLRTIVRHGSDFTTHDGMNCIFVPLVGEQGWANEPRGPG
jgi:protein-L-isoaspartate(D-aspartate) O-methyltransferase